MSRKAKIAAIIIGAIVLGVSVEAFLGLPRRTQAVALNPNDKPAAFISVDEITRNAGPMPTHAVEKYHNEKLD